MEKLIKIVLFFVFCSLTICDCPIMPYPRRTTLGFINAQINNDANLHNTINEYSYPLSQQLIDSTVNVAIGIVALQFNPYGRIDFLLQYFPTTSLATLKFRAKLVSQNYGWRMIRFSFFASQSSLFQVNAQTTNQFSVGPEMGKYAIYRPIPNFGSVQGEPIIKIFISGVTLKALPLDEEYSAMVNQFQTFKMMSTSSALIRYFTEAIQIKKSLQIKISDIKILSRLYSFQIETNSDIASLSFSYVIFSKKSLTEMHNFISDSFGFGTSGEYKFSSLQNMDMLMTGLIGLKVPREDLYIFTLGINNMGGQSLYSMNTNFKYLDLSFTYLGLQMKLAYVCQECTNSPFIYQNKMCIEKCPSGFSVSMSGGAQFCDKCDIDKIKVVDVQSGKCVCARRHYLQISSDSCKPCSYDCMTCDNSYRCLTCDNNLLQTKRVMASDGRCRCPAVGFYDDKSNEDIVCQKCDDGCFTCKGPKPHDCLTCSKDKERDPNGFCVCRNGFVEDNYGNCVCPEPRKLTSTNICLDILSSCKENQIEQYIDLTRRCVCRPGYMAILNDCIKCSQNSIFNQESLKCECQKPTVQSQGQCKYCNMNQVYDDITKSCVCKDGTYQRTDGSCVICPPRMVLLNDVCECAFNYYEDSGVCKRCRRETDGPKCRRNLY